MFKLLRSVAAHGATAAAMREVFGDVVHARSNRRGAADREIPAAGESEAMIEPRETVVAKLHEVQETECDGQDTAALWLGVLRKIDAHEAGLLRDQMIRQFAVEVAEIRLCRFCWRPIEILLRMLLVPPRVQ
jgi:hypothetical protein